MNCTQEQQHRRQQPLQQDQLQQQQDQPLQRLQQQPRLSPVEGQCPPDLTPSTRENWNEKKKVFKVSNKKFFQTIKNPKHTVLKMCQDIMRNNWNQIRVIYYGVMFGCELICCLSLLERPGQQFQ